MGKRKRRSDNIKTPPSSDINPHAHQVDLQSERRSFDQAESSATTESLPSVMDVMDSTLKRPSNQSRTILLRHSRHPFGRHYSRRSSTNHSDASPSNWKGISPLFDNKLSFKLENKDFSDFPFRETRERIFQKPERIRSSSLSQTAVSGDVRKMECRICHKRLRKNPYVMEESLSSSNDLSVVAVLVCGHAYHADCLEQKTSHEDKQDPPCPLCVSHVVLEDA